MGIWPLWVAKGFFGCWGMSGCQRSILHGKQDAAQHLSSHRQQIHPRSRQPTGNRGHKHRTEGNKCSPIINTLIVLWISASMEEQSSPDKWAQQGMQHPPTPPQNASLYRGSACRVGDRVSLSPHSAPSASYPFPTAQHPTADVPKSHPTVGTLARRS